ncbi:MAG: hypothetical protein HY368_02850 [Candidatus Aenigmarchaeota archaeon]|nr:hypothetical protein [Candidatus Aenigmarchaeota archaeon]
MRIVKALKEKPVHALASAIFIFLLPSLIQRLSTSLAFEIWFKTFFEKPLSGTLYLMLSLLFGAFISLYFYNRNKCIDCKKKDISAGFGGATLGFVLGICPACISFIAFLLPLSATILLTTYAPVFTLLSILALGFSIHKLGGFKK